MSMIPHVSRNASALALVLCILAAGPTRAEDEPKVNGVQIEYAGGQDTNLAYLSRPGAGDGPFPAILVVHEWWGLTEWIKENADRLAGQGYVVMAVDLYGGKVTEDAEEAHELMRALDDGEALADLKDAIEYLKGLDPVEADRPIGVIGWCMGGKYARLIAQASETIGPAVICYGSVATEDAQLEQLRDNSILGIFGADDRGIPADRVEEFGEKLKAAGGGPPDRYDMVIYPDAGHAFMRPGGPQYRAEAAEDAWGRIERFFRAAFERARD